MAAKESLVLTDIFGGEKVDKKRATHQIPRRAGKGTSSKKLPRVKSRLTRSIKFIRDLQELLEQISKLLRTLGKILVRLIGLILLIAGTTVITAHLCAGKPFSHEMIIPILRALLRN